MAEAERVWVSPRASESSSATAGRYGLNLRRIKARPSSSHYRRFRFPRSRDRLRVSRARTREHRQLLDQMAERTPTASSTAQGRFLPDVGDREWPFQARLQ